ncbi:hypothetical protein BJ123_102160 [Rhodopseudomonas thermotolerans]|uniref:Uncharacterized protein n=2 Tax=Rhodopseudomonas TaxID=1073 RepID=A0A336JMR8_9BRAD|nr:MULTISPECIES: hypothetical protein [Rhodopseudomonas]RED41989.1 hypothetical protein BJ125_102158 [Rhodopseudomonas pentothenatexigens]REG07450.1 hypothetical protein BJ123_102160 [Rhodopseudomonas thermotolerans]SSW89349.1 hypothetical protein SAMN05892882_102158 [Rhodopseudomonas pentothenatexigens]
MNITDRHGHVLTPYMHVTKADSEKSTNKNGLAFEGDVYSFADLMKAHPEAVRKVTSAEVDEIARVWLQQQETAPRGGSDNEPDDVYATVKVGNQVVAKLYNGGIAEMSNATASAVSGLDEPSLVGPALAQWRAETYARLLGGNVEIADTAKAQSEWTPRSGTAPQYSRAELDAAIAAMQKGTTQSPELDRSA